MLFSFQILERALQECGNDLDAAIKSLHGLCLGSADENSGTAAPQPEANVVDAGTIVWNFSNKLGIIDIDL